MLKHCHCGKPATVEHQGQLLCSEHAFDKIMVHKGPVPPVKSLRS
jgi:hypothetical protein